VQFHIACLVLKLFENIHLLLILNVLCDYLGVAVDSYSCLLMTLLFILKRLWSLKTLNAFSLFVLSSVLLQVKQKFKHGRVDKCDICMGRFGILDLIRKG